MVPVAIGAWFGLTVTSMLWLTERPPGSRAVTVSVAVPSAPAAAVARLPDSVTLTTAVSVVATS